MFMNGGFLSHVVTPMAIIQFRLGLSGGRSASAWAQLGQPDLQVGLHALVEVAAIHEDGLGP